VRGGSGSEVGVRGGLEHEGGSEAEVASVVDMTFASRGARGDMGV